MASTVVLSTPRSMKSRFAASRMAARVRSLRGGPAITRPVAVFGDLLGISWTLVTHIRGRFFGSNENDTRKIGRIHLTPVILSLIYKTDAKPATVEFTRRPSSRGHGCTRFESRSDSDANSPYYPHLSRP